MLGESREESYSVGILFSSSDFDLVIVFFKVGLLNDIFKNVFLEVLQLSQVQRRPWDDLHGFRDGFPLDQILLLRINFEAGTVSFQPPRKQ